MRLLLTGVALGVLIAGAAVAQDQGVMPPPPPGGAGGPPPMGRMMEPLKRADVSALVAKHFAMLDLNKDGVIDDADKVAMVAKRRADRDAAMKARRDRMFAVLDANKDGQISRAEFDAPPPMGERGPGERGPGGPGGPDGRGPGGPDGDRPDHMRGPGPDGPGRDGPGGVGGRGGPGGFGMMGGRLLERADANHDGKVTLAEAQKAALAAFDKADVNHDGVIDRDEMVVAMRDHGRWDDRGGADGGRRHGGREGK
jgi:Ca2+-binding EF-hand superfamily protein